MKNKVAFIVPYFGRLPDYFQLFLDSCRENSCFDWLIFSDDTTAYSYPDNVHLINMDFEQCRKLVQSKFEFPITLHKPQKLCDYKCAYGYIFPDFLKEYHWWGHCDLDQIFGRLNGFINDEMLDKYDKIGSIGHLTLYRNAADNNRVFMSTDRYKEVFTTQRGCGFDEWIGENINEIYLNSDREICLGNKGADINPYHTVFRCVEYDVENRRYISDGADSSVFVCKEGRMYRVYKKDGDLVSREYPYIHLQKRRMTDKRRSKTARSYCVVPNSFVDYTEDTAKLLSKQNIWKAANYQYFKVKYNSLKYRIKNADWQFGNVFK